MSSLIQQVLVEDPKQFDSVVNSYVNKNYVVLVYITGATDKLTNKSWCPDCVYSAPVIDNMFENIEEQLQDKEIESANIVFIKCPCPRDDYKKADHPYRTHEKVQVKSIPTLILYEQSPTSYRMRIVEGQFRDSTKVLKFAAEVVQRVESLSSK
jgi:thiol-disulfide isomerase/thioredoxin